MSRFARALEEHRDELDSLNVYPVPDGDTGTNLHLTQRSVLDAMAGLPDGVHLRDLGAAIARASLMGARGNSGVILAQVLRGLSERVGDAEAAGPAELAAALGRATEEAFRAVAHPKEGTVLTVLSEASGAAWGAAESGRGLGAVAEVALEAGRASLERTRQILPELRAAGVVDAGGKGIVLLLDAMASALAGHPMTEAVGPLGPVGHTQGDAFERPSFKYEVVYLLDAPDDRVPALTDRLSRLGDSVVVVGGGGMFKVHVHTDDPSAAVDEAAEAGRPRDVQVVDLEEQVAAQCVAGQARAVRIAEQQPAAVVAVADGDGLARIFRSLGALVVPGGAGRTPSAGELVEAVEAAPAGSVLLLPNHRDVLPAAEQAAGASRKDVRVVPTRSIPEGLAAAAAFNPTATPEENEKEMDSAADGSSTGEITRDARDAGDADAAEGSVGAGRWLGVADGRVRVTGDAAAEVAVRLARELRAGGHEILTLIVGKDLSDQEAAAVEEALRGAAPNLLVEVHRGGQPHPAYLIGLE